MMDVMGVDRSLAGGTERWCRCPGRDRAVRPSPKSIFAVLRRAMDLGVVRSRLRG